MCQRVVEITMNKVDNDSRKQMEPDFSEVCIQKMQWKLFRDYYVVYGYDHSHGTYEVEIYTSLSVSQKFEKFVEKISHDSSIAFILNQTNAPFVPLFVQALLKHLGRKSPIDAENDSDIVQTWLSNNEHRRDIFATSLALNWNWKAKFIINLSSKLLSNEQMFGVRNAISQYSHICLPTPSKDELKAMTFLSSGKNKQTDQYYTMHRNNMEKYLRRTDF
jgi:hypothetical protein